MKRIICIGNRYIREDAAGPAVYDLLSRCSLPQDIEVIDGGLAGLDLLRFVEGAQRVVFVDQVCGFTNNAEPVVIAGRDVEALACRRYDHSAGLTYLLKVLPALCNGNIPDIALVGIEGEFDDRLLEKAALLAVDLASGETRNITAPGRGKVTGKFSEGFK